MPILIDISLPLVDNQMKKHSGKFLVICHDGWTNSIGIYIGEAPQVPGIFISRIRPGSLAESSGILTVNDEVFAVNGIEVAGKSFDEVTDMMVANIHNLIITLKKLANQEIQIVQFKKVSF